MFQVLYPKDSITIIANVCSPQLTITNILYLMDMLLIRQYNVLISVTMLGMVHHLLRPILL